VFVDDGALKDPSDTCFYDDDVRDDIDTDQSACGDWTCWTSAGYAFIDLRLEVL